MNHQENLELHFVELSDEQKIWFKLYAKECHIPQRRFLRYFLIFAKAHEADFITFCNGIGNTRSFKISRLDRTKTYLFLSAEEQAWTDTMRAATNLKRSKLSECCVLFAKEHLEDFANSGLPPAAKGTHPF